MLQYLLFKRGIMADSPHEVIGLCAHRGPDLDRPDVQLFGGPFSLTRDDEAGKFDFDKHDGMQICAYQMRPETQGRFTIESPDAAVQPVIRPRYLATDLDQATAVSMVRYVREAFRVSRVAALRRRGNAAGQRGAERRGDPRLGATHGNLPLSRGRHLQDGCRRPEPSSTANCGFGA